MEALFILLIFSLALGGTFLAAFFWAQRSGQFDDTETPALRMLFDEADAARLRKGPAEKTPVLSPGKSPRHTTHQKKITGEHYGS